MLVFDFTCVNGLGWLAGLGWLGWLRSLIIGGRGGRGVPSVIRKLEGQKGWWVYVIGNKGWW